MKCEKCDNEAVEIITISNKILIRSGYPIGIKICANCYKNMPLFISVINKNSGKEECIPETEFNKNLHGII